VTGIVSTIIAMLAARKGVTVGADGTTELANWVVGVGLAAGTAGASAAGALFRKYVIPR
jgi:hypothetical protein